MSDRLRPRVRTYSESGDLEAAFGRFGDGPLGVSEKLSAWPRPALGGLWSVGAIRG